MWNEIMNKEKAKPYFQELIKFIDLEYETKTIFPKREDIFNAFTFCPFENTKVIILGQDPYHDVNQAHGLSFSVRKGNKIPPSLRNIYKELHADLNVDIPVHGELTSWAKQGVLLLNTILTVQAHKPLSHKNKGWERFTNVIIQELNRDKAPKVFVLWGNNAKKYETYITNQNHLVISSSHPSPLSARHSFFGSRLFSKINEFLYNEGREGINFSIE